MTWKNQLRRLRVRDERRNDVHFGLLALGGCVAYVLAFVRSC